VFVPPLSTAIVALLSSRRHAGALAYISGSLGTPIGADLLDFNTVRGLGAPVASVGGAGTFGIFLTGILGVLLAVIFGRAMVRKAARATEKCRPGRPELLAVSHTLGSISRCYSSTAGKRARGRFL